MNFTSSRRDERTTCQQSERKLRSRSSNKWLRQTFSHVSRSDIGILTYEHTCYSIHIIVGNNTPADTHTHKCTHETRFSKPANWFIVNVHKLIWTVETVTHSGIYGPSMANPTITTIKRNDVHILTKCSRFLFIYIKATDLVGIKQMVGLKRWKENPSQRPPFVHYTPSK